MKRSGSRGRLVPGSGKRNAPGVARSGSARFIAGSGGQGYSSAGSGTLDAGASGSSLNAQDALLAILANKELRLVKENASDTTKRFHTLLERNEVLAEELRRNDVDSICVARHVELELKNVQELLQQKTEEADALRSQMEVVQNQITARYEDHLRRQDEQVQRLSQIVAEQQCELEAVSTYSSERHRLVAEIEHLREQMEEAKKAHEADLSQLRFQTVDRKIRLNAIEQHMYAKFNSEVEAQAQTMIDDGMKQLLEENASLRSSTIVLSSDVVELAELVDTREKESADARRRALLERTANMEALRHTVQMGRTAQENDQRIHELEARCALLQEKLLGSQRTFELQHRSEVEDLKCQLSEAHASLEVHQRELKKMKRLAQLVVGQRTGLEHFFYQAIEDLRKMRSASRKEPPGTGVRPPSSLAGLSPSGQGTQDTSSLSHPKRTQDVTQLDDLLSPDVACMGSTSVFLTETEEHLRRLRIKENSKARLLPHAAIVGSASDTRKVPVATRRDSSAAEGGPATRKSSGFPATSPLPGLPRRCYPEHRRAASLGIRARTEFHSSLPSQGKEHHSTAPLGNLRSDTVNGEASAMPPSGVYFENMSWDEKERIIKALLFYVNNSALRATATAL